MELFLDTASIEDIKKWQEFGVVNGVTTNPTLLAKEGNDALSQLKEICKIVAGPVSAQVIYDSHKEMIHQAVKLSKVSENVVVKFPCTIEGFKAAKAAVESSIKCNITLTFDPSQAIPFALLPVTYISLIVGREEDFGLYNLQRLKQVHDILCNIRTKTKMLAASIRNTHHLVAAVQAEADVITIPPSTWNNILHNPQSISGELDFLNSWKNLPKELREAYEKI